MSTLLGEARVRIRPDTMGFLSDAQRDISRHGTALGRTFSGAFKAGSLALGGIAIAAGLAAKSTLDIGVTYQNSMNTLQAVSKASAATMEDVGATAKRLGSDISLPATSAADAAAAMTELAKGGLSVDEAMKAAKGTLQLAAAAQVDAAEAATIQSAALNAFNLEADQAGRVADVLSNAANAAAGEITDFAWALQAGGAVANGMKIPLEDTAAALGLLANNGIRGSDAGTLLKSALLALQSPSKPAQKAMEDLGLSAYDAAGNFVGLKSVFGQLEDASKTMTDQQYAAATSTLFGSDAARLAAIAASDGAEGFDKMAKAMREQGSAADVAAAKAKGVGGAIEAFKSQVETFQIDLFERGAPNIEKLIRYAADHFPAFGNAIVGGVEDAIDIIGDLKDVGVTAFREVRDYLEPLTSEIAEFVTELDDAHGIGEAVFDLLKVGGGVLIGVAQALEPLVKLGGGLLDFFNDLPGPVKTAVLALAALKVASKFNLLSNLGLDAKTGAKAGVTGRLRGVGESFVGFGQTVRANMKIAGQAASEGDDAFRAMGFGAEDSGKRVGRFSRVMGGFSAGFQTYMPSMTREVTSFGSAVKTAFAESKRDARFNFADRMGLSVRDLHAATGDIAGLGGAAKAAAKGGLGALRSAGGGLVSFLGGPWGAALAGASVAVGLITSRFQEAADTEAKWAEALGQGGAAARLANDAMRAQQAELAKNDEGFGGFINKITGYSAAQRAAAPDMDAARDAARSYFKSLSPVEQAQSKVAEWTSTLSDRLQTLGPDADATKIAQERLAFWTGQVQTRQEGLASAAQTTTQKLQEQAQVALAGTNADLAASMATTALSDGMESYRKSMADATLTASQHQQASDQLSQTALQTANALAQQAFAHSKAADDEGKQADADRALYDSLVATAKQLGTATPKAITDLIGSLSATSSASAQTAAEVDGLATSVRQIPGTRFVQIDAPTAKQKKDLEDLGYVVTTLPNGTVVVSADTGPAEAEIQALMEKERTVRINAIVARTAREDKDFQDGMKKATGGILRGPGTGTSDSIPILASNGEYVVKAKSVAKYGLGLLDSINAGRFADGGQVGRSKALLPREEALTASRARTSSSQDAPFTYAPTFVVDPRNGSVRDQMGDAMFELRRLRRGGRP